MKSRRKVEEAGKGRGGGELTVDPGQDDCLSPLPPPSWGRSFPKLGGDRLLLQNLQSQQLQAKPHIQLEVGGAGAV